MNGDHRTNAAAVKDMPPAGALRLRDGGGAARGCRPSGRAWGAPIPSTADPGRAEQTRPRGVKVVRTVARSTLTPLNHACSTVCGSTADGMGAGVSGGLRRP